jgi:hypothetical protein
VLRWPGLEFNGAAGVSALLPGSHYLVDLVADGALAGLSIVGASSAVARIASRLTAHTTICESMRGTKWHIPAGTQPGRPATAGSIEALTA